MAVSSTSSAGGSSVASIDVASVVDQLMKAENKPLDAISTKIDQQKLVISDLGTIKSKISVFQDALKDFENTNSYNTVDVTYLDKSVLTASGSNGALLGNFSVKVNATASADTWTIGGFSTSKDLIAVDSGGFNLTVAGTTYNSKVPPAGVSALPVAPSIQDLAYWINSLGVDVAASVSQTTDSSHYVLQIFGKSTGLANAVSFSGISAPSSPTLPAISKIQGVSAVTESGTVTFSNLVAGDSVTVAGLTLTASSSISANDVATAFANLAAGAISGNIISGGGGSWTGTLSGWGTGSASSANVTFTSSVPGADVTDLSVSGTTSSATPVPTVSKIQGVSAVTERGTVTFNNLALGDSVTVAGLTLTASSSISANDVATAFANLAAGATSGNSVSGGTWTGTLSGWGTGSASSANVTFTSSAPGTNVTDLSVSVSSGAVHSTQASDAKIVVNGTTFIRSSNVINDVIDGVTLNLFNSSDTAQVVHVGRGSDNSELVIKKMIEAYNDLISTYKEMTANSYNSTKPGTFANNPTTLSFINEIKARFSKGITYGSAMTKTLSLGTVGIDLQLDGMLKFNDIAYINAQSNGLQSKLAQGLSVGYTSSTNNLKKYISDLVGITGGGGSLSDVMTTETEQINDLYKRQLTLQDKLSKVQENLVTQYSSLNALLYQLSSTSNALSNAFAALTNSNNK